MNKRRILVALCALSLGSAVFAAAQKTKEPPKTVAAAQEQQPTAVANAPEPESSPQPPAAIAKPSARSIEAAERLEGEKRFRTNCGRCHQAPHKFSPRTMATVIRHMRVRAMITDEDQRLILRYMTQ
ncbi:MAG TPA: cytochrome c [Candidatus Bathyarchaeia archaeon]|nr:cytochrome c [Candidatus Bathyarchaeia archaeon]